MQLAQALEKFFEENPEYYHLTNEIVEDGDGDITFSGLAEWLEVVSIFELADFAEEAKTLSPKQQTQFTALLYWQTMWDFMDSIAGDGLYSIFYNNTGSQIKQILNFFKQYPTAISQDFEKLYQALDEKFKFIEDDNLVSRVSKREESSVAQVPNNKDFFDFLALSDEHQQLLDNLEEKIENNWDELYAEYLRHYNQIVEKAV